MAYPLLDKMPLVWYYSNSVDTDQKLQNAAFDQDQQCLLKFYAKYNRMRTSTRTPKTRNWPIQIIRIDKSTGQGPVVQSIVSLTSSLRGQLLSVLPL